VLREAIRMDLILFIIIGVLIASYCC